MSNTDIDSVGARQAAHYDRLAAVYEAHYSDRWSLEYRARFISGPMTSGLDLRGMRVLDAMCGSGELAAYLVEQGADVVGLDVSPAVIERFREKHPRAAGIVGSVFETGLPAESFDCVAITSGLHHVQPNVQAAIDEMHRVLKPGGWLVFTEPHVGSAMDALRRLWYRFDPVFEENEQAIDLPALERANADRFEFVSTLHGGNVAYLLVLNSMIFRVPHWLKNAYSPALMTLEGWLQKAQSRRTSCMVTVQWRKRAAGRR